MPKLGLQDLRAKAADRLYQTPKVRVSGSSLHIAFLSPHPAALLG